MNRKFYGVSKKTTRIDKGRITVRLPWREEEKFLPTNWSIAANRTLGILGRFQGKIEQLVEYNNIFVKQIITGIIEQIPSAYNQYSNNRLHYLAHQPVIKESSATTQVRIVFDGSAKLKGKPSINDCLYPGPSLLPSLIGSLVRSRCFPILLIADVEKAFHQIAVDPKDRDACRFLWFKQEIIEEMIKDPERMKQKYTYRDLVEFRFARVPFGLTSSPFLLAASIIFYVNKAGIPETDKQAILRDLYVDNMMVGCVNEQEALRLYNESKELFGSLAMNLREYASNSEQVRNAIPADDKTDKLAQKLLGVQWDMVNDTYSITGKLKNNKCMSKADIYSAVASIFDPLGLCLPWVVQARKFAQSLWGTKRKWKDKITQQEQVEWNSICEQTSQFAVWVNRAVSSPEQENMLSIFSDANKGAYAAVAYIQQKSGVNRSPNFLMCKGRLISAKTEKSVTKDANGTLVPKAELLGIQLAFELATFILNQTKNIIKYSNVQIFSNSEIALCWVSKENLTKKTFIQNRVRCIRGLAGNIEKEISLTVHYVPTEQNPAHLGTKQVLITTPKKGLWFHGPKFLNTPKTEWQETIQKVFIVTEELGGN